MDGEVGDAGEDAGEVFAAGDLEDGIGGGTKDGGGVRCRIGAELAFFGVAVAECDRIIVDYEMLNSRRDFPFFSLCSR